MADAGWPKVLVVTGTDTDVGKTVVTAAIVATLRAAARTVVAYKPTQTGVAPDEPGDMAEVARLTGAPTSEGVRLRAPMAPRPAAALEDATLPTLDDHLAAVHRLGQHHDHVVVEGAGGLLVELTEAGETVADLARLLPGSGIVLVARSALGTLNHTMLTLEALAHRGIRTLGVVIGGWPEDPSVVETTNRDYLEALPEGLLGAVPWGAPALAPEAFRAAAPTWLPRLHDGLTGP
ncbi:dethiobiotin synthase [Terrabacter sp. MAHUQ-38]|uniref:dethiobiotin synthase n=1 Tax=unclassified Terrabacter TaxID=2630222 RepID=UPI00165D5CA5|nr:dethiobiotin synthase [Terrabacter sp. MAHUQ-38]MBC9821549.1 dethiobiotin synthase [Terrabacter sp. MAHUQ-38]